MIDNACGRTLRRALEVMGGVESLAAALSVSVQDVQSWLDGAIQPSQSIFLQALDIVARGRSSADRE